MTTLYISSTDISTKENIDSWSRAAALRVFSARVVSLSWNLVVPTEFITASDDGSVRVWRVSSDDGTVSVKMLWGTNLRRLCTAGMVLEGATGLSPIHQTLMAQRGTFDKSMFSDGNWSEDDDDPFGLFGGDDGSDDGSEGDGGSDNGFEDDYWLDDGFEDEDGSDDEE